MDNRELDKAIAEKFFRLHVDKELVTYDDGSKGSLPFYTLNPTDNSLVLDEIERHEWNWELSYKWNSYFMVIYGWKDPSAEPGKMIKVYAKVWNDNRYQAICEAALQAVEAAP